MRMRLMAAVVLAAGGLVGAGGWAAAQTASPFPLNPLPNTPQPGTGPAERGPGNPFLGAWTSQSAVALETDVYRPDGVMVITTRFTGGQLAGLTMRIAARYQVSPMGGNQFRIDIQVDDYVPRRMCSTGPAGVSCVPFPAPPLPPSIVVTLLDGNTADTNGLRSVRDPSPFLSQIEVPADAMVASAGGGAPLGGGGNAGGLPDLCAVGQTQCDISGWRKFCERSPNGQANWMYHGVRCRNGYGQREF